MRTNLLAYLLSIYPEAAQELILLLQNPRLQSIDQADVLRDLFNRIYERWRTATNAR